MIVTKRMLVVITFALFSVRAFAFEIDEVSTLHVENDGGVNYIWAKLWLVQTINCQGNITDVLKVNLGREHSEFAQYGSNSVAFANYTTLLNAAQKKLNIEVNSVGALTYQSNTCKVKLGNSSSTLRIGY